MRPVYEPTTKPTVACLHTVVPEHPAEDARTEQSRRWVPSQLTEGMHDASVITARTVVPLQSEMVFVPPVAQQTSPALTQS